MSEVEVIETGQQMRDGLTVTFEVGEDWPTPNHCRRAADAMDTLAPARYGAILRAYADAEDARYEAHGPYRVALRREAVKDGDDERRVEGCPRSAANE